MKYYYRNKNKNQTSFKRSVFAGGGAAFLVAMLPATAQASGFLAGLFGGGGGGGGSLSGFFGGFLQGLLGGAAGSGGFLGGVLSGLFGGGVGDPNLCDGTVTGTVGAAICNVVYNSHELPGLITAFAYMMGLMFTVAALFKLKDHVLNPNQTPLSDAVKRFVAGGGMFSLPIVTEAATNLLTNGGALDSYDQTGLAGSVAGGYGLDTMLVAMMADLYAPIQLLLGGFGYLAGLVFIVIGISRLVKTAQEGPRGPSGLGTIMTFVVAGVLFSLDSIMGAFSESMFQDTTVYTFASFAGDGTGDSIVDDHVMAVISSVIGFMTLIGWISFIRGFFILRAVAEGGGQASLMAAVTHIFGGALAVNLGPLMNAVQSTFGLSSFGITFS